MTIFIKEMCACDVGNYETKVSEKERERERERVIKLDFRETNI